MVMLLTGCGVKDWDRADQLLFASSMTAHVIDGFQTYEILTNDNYHDIVPGMDELGPDFVVPVFAGIAVGEYLIADYLEGKRTWFLGGMNALSWGLVIRNESIGVKINF